MAKRRRKDTSNKILVRRDASLASCPSCNRSFTLRRSRSRSMRETVIRTITPFKTYRCRECGWRGHKSNIIVTWRSLRNLVMYMLISLFAAFMVFQVIKKMVE